MRDPDEKFLLPGQIERHLAALSKLYELEGEREMQTLVVNAQTRVHEGWHYDNWDGGTYGHALYLLLPEQIYIKSVRNLEAIQSKILDDINKIHNVHREHISDVFIEMNAPENEDWRGKSGLLSVGRRSVSDQACKRIWEDGDFRLFLSHKTESKVETATLKEAGLIDAIIRSDGHGCPFGAIVRRLTWEGHEFLAKAKNDTVWKKVLQQAEEKGMSTSMTVINGLLEAAAKKYIGLE